MKFTLLALTGMLALAAAWTKEDHEIFRLKDELEAHEGPGITFYEFLSIPPTATQDEINKAYRKKSKLLHPDKAKQSFLAEHATSASKASRAAKKTASKARAAGAKPTNYVSKPPSQREIQKATKAASERFTRLGLIANILRGSGRARYDHFLANGFPAWRGADYYYSRFRPGLGTVLTGLFLFAGGAVHYGVLVLGHRRRKDFVHRYIRQARTLAWGDASSAAGVPGIDSAGDAAAASSAVEPEPEGAVAPMNRRERRAQEKADKGKKASRRAAKNGSGTSTPRTDDAGNGTAAAADGPVPGAKKRVQAENGKVLVVDSAGNVFLEEEDEDGDAQLYLLDPDEEQPPTFRQTVVVRLPIWLVGKVKEKLSGGGKKSKDDTLPSITVATGDSSGKTSKKGKGESADELDGFVNVQDEDAYEKSGATSGKKGKKSKAK